MRLFIAIEPSPAFRTAVSALQDRLRAAGITGSWLSPSNLHLTLAFIGMCPDDVSVPLPAVPQPFTMTLSHPGVFPKARVLYAGAEPVSALSNLSARVRNTLSDAGIPFDGQGFIPHITLARKPVIPADTDLSGIVIPPTVMTVREVCLYRSEHTDSGMKYTVIARSGETAEHRQ